MDQFCYCALTAVSHLKISSCQLSSSERVQTVTLKISFKNDLHYTQMNQSGYRPPPSSKQTKMLNIRHLLPCLARQAFRYRLFVLQALVFLFLAGSDSWTPHSQSYILCYCTSELQKKVYLIRKTFKRAVRWQREGVYAYWRAPFKTYLRSSLPPSPPNPVRTNLQLGKVKKKKDVAVKISYWIVYFGAEGEGEARRNK